MRPIYRSAHTRSRAPSVELIGVNYDLSFPTAISRSQDSHSSTSLSSAHATLGFSIHDFLGGSASRGVLACCRGSPPGKICCCTVLPCVFWVPICFSMDSSGLTRKRGRADAAANGNGGAAGSKKSRGMGWPCH